MNYRQQRGILISKTKDKIRCIDADTYEVWSQTTPDVRYTLKRTAAGWDCSCPDTIQHYCKHAYAVEHRLGMKARADRGMLIHQSKDQVEHLASDHYLVRSQSGNGTYEVRDFGHGWMCSCPDHTHTGSVCKHIQAVQWRVGERRTIKPHDNSRCKFCDSTNIVKKGVRGTKQQYGCKDCGRRFIQNLGFERRRATPEQICDAVELWYGGLSSRKVVANMASKGLHVSYKTIQNWGKVYGMLMEEYFDSIQPQVGEVWRTDEIHLKIKGKKRYLFAMLDSETRYWIAKQVAEHKGKDDVAPMFKQAKKVADKIPTTLISDKAANFHHAWKQQYRAKNFLHKDTQHINEVAFDGIHHNNQMESFNGNTIRHREKVTRGIKTEDSGVITGLQTYHNFVRPHLGLPDNQTPAEAAGIHVQGTNKLKTIIQAATKERRA